MKTRRVTLALVFLALGFIISFAYQQAKKEPNNPGMTDSEWERNLELSEKLTELEERNNKLQHQLLEKQEKIAEIENNLAGEKNTLAEMAFEAEKLRMFLGKVKVGGEGIVVSLNDGSYYPEGGNINNFIVHEHHVLKVVNELIISGAEAVAINGKRLTSQTYIICNGPVITVDGEQFPAPFTISAIGNSDTLEKALNIQGGVKDQLVADNVVVRIEKKDYLEMNPIFSKVN